MYCSDGCKKAHEQGAKYYGPCPLTATIRYDSAPGYGYSIVYPPADECCELCGWHGTRQ